MYDSNILIYPYLGYTVFVHMYYCNDLIYSVCIYVLFQEPHVHAHETHIKHMLDLFVCTWMLTKVSTWDVHNQTSMCHAQHTAQLQPCVAALQQCVVYRVVQCFEVCCSVTVCRNHTVLYHIRLLYLK